MGRILAIDYGTKRTGLAISDPLKIIANDLETIDTHKLMAYLEANISALNIDKIILGYPKDLMNRPTNATKHVEQFAENFKKKFISIPIQYIDERLSSKMAAQTLHQMGLNKKKRQEKSRLDKISALILLQGFLQ